MAKNPEELYEQKEFERRHFSRPTLNKLKVAELEREIADLNEQLALVRNTNDHINNELDKRINTLDQVNGIIRDVKTGKISDAMFKSDVISVMGWRR